MRQVFLASQLDQNLFNQMQPAQSTDIWSNTHNQILYSRLICSTYPKLHIPLFKLLLKEVLLVLILILAHLKPKGKQTSGRLHSPRIGWLNLLFFFQCNLLPPKSQLKKLDWHNISRLKNIECPRAIFGPVSHKVHKTLLTLQLAAKIVLSKET